MDEKKIHRLYREFLIELEKELGSGTTYSTDLDRVGKQLFKDEWRGVFAVDDNLPTEGCFLVNTDKRGGEGEHWLAVRNGYYYDSFGRKANSFFPGSNFQESPDYDAEQAKKEENCGCRCLAWLLCAKYFGKKAMDCL